MFTLLLLLAVAGDPTQGPALTVEPGVIDFGDVPQEYSAQRLLQVHNRSDRPIRVLGTDADCRCLSSTCSTSTLAPGESLTWPVTLETCHGYIGEVRRRAWLTTDHPDFQRLAVAIRYRVVPDLYLQPASAAIGIAKSGDLIECEVEIHTRAERAFQLLGANSENPQIVAEVLEAQVTADRPGRIRLRVQPLGTEGPFRQSVSVYTDCSSMPELRIPVAGEVIQGLSSSVREVVFDAVALRTSPEQKVEFICQSGSSVGTVRTSDPGIVPRKVERQDDRVTVTLSPDQHLPLGEFRGALCLDVSASGRQRTVRLPYRGRVVVAPETQPTTQKATDLAVPGLSAK